MSIKASTQITISKVIDVYAVYRYYKLQSSTLAKPSKPATNPPSGWSDTEPAYVSGSTNTLYFVDCNVYSDKTFSFSEVSKSSSYEAAKDAWNKANNAQNTVDNLEIGGRNLAISSGDLTKWTLESGVTVTKEGDWFKVLDSVHTTARWGIYLDVVIEPNTTYTFSVYGKKGNVKAYAGGGPIETNTFGKNYEIIDDEKLIVTLTSGSSEKIWRVYLCVMPSTAGAYAYFKLPKLEKGNKPTDWTPAPEDSIAKIDVEYYLSTSATSLAGGSWTTKAPTWVDGKYMWSRTVTVDGAGNKTYSPNQNGVCIAGAKGNNGKDAAVISSTEPSDKTYLWCDTSVSPPVLKQWNGEEWIVVNDNAEQITQIYKEITNSITQSSENIMMQVGEKTYSKEAVDRLLSDMNTSFEQTKNSFGFEFNRFQTALNDLSNSTDTKFENTSKYIRFVDGEIYIGVEGNPIMLRLRNDRLSFLENNAEVAYISNRTLYFTHAEVLKDLKIGRFAWVAMDSGYMALKLVE